LPSHTRPGLTATCRAQPRLKLFNEPLPSTRLA
jgi:hypothetical protein